MKTSILSLLAVLGLAAFTPVAHAEDPAPFKITPETQALIAQLLQMISSMKGDLQSLGLEVPPELAGLTAKTGINAPTFLPESAVTGSTTSSATTAPSIATAISTLAKPTQTSSLSTGGLVTSHLSTSSASLDGKPRMTDSDWRRLFPKSQP